MTYELQHAGRIVRTSNNPAELREWATMNVGNGEWEIYLTGVLSMRRYNGSSIDIDQCELNAIRRMRAAGETIEAIRAKMGYKPNKHLTGYECNIEVETKVCIKCREIKPLVKFRKKEKISIVTGRTFYRLDKCRECAKKENQLK